MKKYIKRIIAILALVVMLPIFELYYAYKLWKGIDIFEPYRRCLNEIYIWDQWWRWEIAIGILKRS